ncbi:MAG TPA: STAS/SEC14 domain-containing protein [Xanthobacteraceae bacterium]|nr:STAS/SEC14 domain-containing protein [Xanthobacteraceae bacterium]
MIEIKTISPGVVRLTVPEKLKADDFRQIAPQIESIVKQQGRIRLLIDATGFGGWENISAFERHIGFVKTHHEKVERIAVIVSNDWQHWVVGTVRMFVHPQVRAYDKRDETAATRWVTE